MIIYCPAHRTHIGAVKCRNYLVKPLRFWVSVIVDEDDILSVSHIDANVSRD